MTWTYETDFTDDTNSVRFLVGDTDDDDRQVQNEEIAFALAQTNDNIYYAAAFIANAIASKYSRLVTTDLDGALRAEYDKLADNYRKLSVQLRHDAQRYSANSFGVYAGGISMSAIETVRQNTDRPESAFNMDQFEYPGHSRRYVDYDV